MQSFQYYVDQMNERLDQLIQTAQKLKEVSLQVISEEELEPLQRRQEELLAEINQIDGVIQKEYVTEMTEVTHQQFHEKLVAFQALNQDFINNLTASHGLIHFELRRLPGENEEQTPPSPSILSNKISFSAKHPDAIETPEKKRKLVSSIQLYI